jgi:uncharacterized Zn finger protein
MLALTEEQVRRLALAESFVRGEAYFHEERVGTLVSRGPTLHAEVEGSGFAPYAVSATVQDGAVTAYSCSCPYSLGGACKHVVAMLLAAIDDPEAVEARPALMDLLAPLDREQLLSLLLQLVERNAELAEEIEVLAPLAVVAPSADETAPLPPPNAGQLRKLVRAAFRTGEQSDNRYYAAREVAEQLMPVIAAARAYLEARQPRSALTALEAIGREFLPAATEFYDDNGYLGEPLQEIAALLVAALLWADLSPQERVEWAARAEEWADTAGEHLDVNGELWVAYYAAEVGWEYPPLQRILRGEADAWEWDATEVDEGEDRPAPVEYLVDHWLEGLREQERWEELLRLASVELRVVERAVALAHLGRTEEAVQVAREGVRRRDQVLGIARALDAVGSPNEALEAAEHGVATIAAGAHYAPALERFTRDLAVRLGRMELAREAARETLRREPTLDDWFAAQTVFGEDWPVAREPLLESLRARKSPDSREPVLIFLHEGLLEDAMKAVEISAWDEMTSRVAEAVQATHPDWAFKAYVTQFEQLADTGSTGNYPAAAERLALARDVLRGAGRAAEWPRHRDNIVVRYGRKYKLRPLIEALE